VRNGLPADRIRVVQNGIDIAAVRAAAEARIPAAADDEGLIAVATGRVTHQKGYDVLVRAHARVITDVPHQLRIYNDGPLLPSIRELVDELGVTGSVSFVDPGEPVLPHVARASVFCLPSRHEGLPLALLEAVALGVPCIAASCSDGVDAALDGGRVGDLVAVEDVDGFATALRAHLLDPGPLRAKAALGPEHARSFDMDVMTQGWVTALTEFTRPKTTPRLLLRPVPLWSTAPCPSSPRPAEARNQRARTGSDV
jgi:glycosyltransferase involved in cell wall biosynthesis